MLHFKERQQLYFADGIFHFIAESFVHLTICEMSENSDFDAAHTATIEAHIDNDDGAHKQMSDWKNLLRRTKALQIVEPVNVEEDSPEKANERISKSSLERVRWCFRPYSIMVWKEHSEEKKKKRASLTRISQALDSQTNEKKRNTITGLMTSIRWWCWWCGETMRCKH